MSESPKFTTLQPVVLANDYEDDSEITHLKEVVRIRVCSQQSSERIDWHVN